MNIVFIIFVLVLLNGCSAPSSQAPVSEIPSPDKREAPAQDPQDITPQSTYVLRQDRLVAALRAGDIETRRAALEEIVADAAATQYASIALSQAVQREVAELMRREADLFKTQRVVEGVTWMVENSTDPELRDAARELLTKGVRSEEEAFRSSAARALSRVGTSADIPVLEEAARAPHLDTAARSQMRDAVLKIGHRQQHDAVLDLLVWGLHVRTDSTTYPDNLNGEVRDYVRRAEAYEPQPLPKPLPSPEWKMVSSARIRYERKMAGLSDHPDAARLALEYVRELSPCYEWEGYHDCPEQEAEFADKYATAHPDSPFRAYLPLLAAHRWLCAAEGFGYEGKAEDSQRSLELFEARVSVARASSNAMIRTAADRLIERRRCLPPATLRP